jgi:hypothetical protein
MLAAQFVLTAPVLAVPPAKVTAQADRKSAQVGQPVLLTVRVRGAIDTPEVKSPAIPDVKITPMGEPRLVPSVIADLEGTGLFHADGLGHLANAFRGIGQMPNAALDPDLAKVLGDPNGLICKPGAQATAGLVTTDYFFTYQVTPERSGPLTLAGFNVSINGQSTTVPPVTLAVTEAKPQPWVQMRLSLSDPTPEPGEEVQLHVDLLIQRAQVTYGGKAYAYLPVSKVALTLPQLDGVKGIEPARPLDQVVQENAIEPGKHGFRVNSYPTEVKLENEPGDANNPALDPGRYRRRLTIPLRVRDGGQVTLAAAHAAGDVFVPAGGNRGQWEQFVTASEPLTFTTLDLRRRADRPRDFTGAVGEVRVTAQASQTDMPAGTPFTLTVRLEGRGSVTSTGPPDLEGRPEFANNFRVRHEDTHTVNGSQRQFTYTLRPLSAGVKEVPPVPVSYFDPKANKFGTVHSEAIPLHVSAAQNATPDAQPAQPVPEPPPQRPDVEPAPQSAPGFDSPITWIETGLAAALVTCLAAWGVSRVHRSRKPLAIPVSPPTALPITRPAAQAPLPPSPTFATVRTTLQEFLRRHFHLPSGEVTAADAEACLRRGGVPEGLARSFAALLDTCETAEFAPGVVNASPGGLDDYSRQLTAQILAALPEIVA